MYNYVLIHRQLIVVFLKKVQMRQGQRSREGYHILSQFHLKSCMNRERLTGEESRARTEQRGAGA